MSAMTMGKAAPHSAGTQHERMAEAAARTAKEAHVRSVLAIGRAPWQRRWGGGGGGGA